MRRGGRRNICPGSGTARCIRTGLHLPGSVWLLPSRPSRSPRNQTLGLGRGEVTRGQEQRPLRRQQMVGQGQGEGTWLGLRWHGV